MSSLTKRFGEKLKKLRKKAKLSQLELSSKAGLDLTTVNELENGNREPMLKTMWRLSNALDVKMPKLVDF